MKTTKLISLTSCLSLFVGCTLDLPASEVPDQTHQQDEIETSSTSTSSQALTAPTPGLPGVLPDLPPNIAPLAPTFTFDASAIAVPPKGQVPIKPLALQSFTTDRLRANLIRTNEYFVPVDKKGTRDDLESAAWHLEANPLKGQVLILGKLRPGPAGNIDPMKLQQDALARLSQWGIGAQEVGEVVRKATVTQSKDAGALGSLAPHRYKTFVFRAIDGVRVEGHRAVITHGLDGSLHRALIRWPALAKTGHRLRTQLPLAEIQKRAGEALRLEGETKGAVKLGWKYVPEVLPSGEVTLHLRAAALIASDAETKEVDIDVNAVP